MDDTQTYLYVPLPHRVDIDNSYEDIILCTYNGKYLNKYACCCIFTHVVVYLLTHYKCINYNVKILLFTILLIRIVSYLQCVQKLMQNKFKRLFNKRQNNKTCITRNPQMLYIWRGF